jgi:hypothetical protein
LTDLKGFLKRYAAVRAIHARMRTARPRLAGLRRSMSRGILIGGLIATYVLLVTPVALVRRAFGKSLVNHARQAGRGWQPIRQSSSDKRIYLDDF